MLAFLLWRLANGVEGTWEAGSKSHAEPASGSWRRRRKLTVIGRGGASVAGLFCLIINLLNCTIYFVLKSLLREREVSAKLWGSSCIGDVKEHSMIPLEAPRVSSRMRSTTKHSKYRESLWENLVREDKSQHPYLLRYNMLIFGCSLWQMKLYHPLLPRQSTQDSFFFCSCGLSCCEAQGCHREL